MKSSTLCAGGLIVAVSSTLFASSARATVWKNYQDESFCLGVSGGNMTPGTELRIWQCNGNPDQSWGGRYDDPSNPDGVDLPGGFRTS